MNEKMLPNFPLTKGIPSRVELMPRRLKYSCCIPKCPNKYYSRRKGLKYENDKVFHAFPRNPHERKCWLKIIKKATGREIPWNNNQRVCSDHFTNKWNKTSSPFAKSGRLMNATLSLFPLEIDDSISLETNESIEINSQQELCLPEEEETHNYFSQIDQSYRHEIAERLQAETQFPNPDDNVSILYHQNQDGSLVDHDYCVTKRPEALCESLLTIISEINFRSFMNALNGTHSTASVPASLTENSVESAMLEDTQTQTEKDFGHDKYEEYRNKKRQWFMKRSKALKARIKAKLSQKQYKFVQSYVNHKACCNINMFTKKQVFSLTKNHKAKDFSVKNFNQTIILPSGLTLKAFLHNMPLKTGYNPVVFNRLAKKVKTMTKDEKYCVLMFHEMRLTSKSVSNSSSDKILGKSEVNCDTALVFMLQGLKKVWKQPVAYYFVNNMDKTEYIKNSVVEIVSKLQEVGLQVVATVCKHSSDNRIVILNLCKDSSSSSDIVPYFLVNTQKIFTIYDPSTLLLATRNLLFAHRIEFEPQKFACIEHIQQTFDVDKNRLLPRLSNIRKKYLKLRKYDLLRLNVDVAVKTFGYPVASCIEDCLGSRGLNTAKFIHQVALLYHSFSSKNRCLQGRRFYKTNRHPILFWNRTLPWIRKWIFHNKSTGSTKCHMPTKQCWITTIKAAKLLYQTHGKRDSKCWKTNLNLDPLQNFFASLQHFGTKKRRLTAAQFTAVYKMSLLNNTVPCSVKMNCRKDDGFLLDNYQDLFKTSGNLN